MSISFIKKLKNFCLIKLFYLMPHIIILLLPPPPEECHFNIDETFARICHQEWEYWIQDVLNSNPCDVLLTWKMDCTHWVYGESRGGRGERGSSCEKIWYENVFKKTASPIKNTLMGRSLWKINIELVNLTHYGCTTILMIVSNIKSGFLLLKGYFSSMERCLI